MFISTLLNTVEGYKTFVRVNHIIATSGLYALLRIIKSVSNFDEMLQRLNPEFNSRELFHVHFSNVSNISFYVLSKALELGSKHLLLREQITVADKVYIGQLQIYLNRHDEAILALEQVVSSEYDNPTSVVIWSKHLRMIVDDRVKSEINESGIDCIILPSVVYALYLLACIYSQVNKDAELEESIQRLEKVCRCLGKYSPISAKLLEHANNLDENRTDKYS